MKSQQTLVTSKKRLAVFFIIFFASVLLLKGISIPSTAQSTEERVLEDTIPKHLPIKVKIKKEKEKAFKDLKNEKWLRDFELEITNTGNKPIYFLDLLVILPEIKAPDGLDIVFPLYYGRTQLGDIETRSIPSDVPIKPGETYVFSLGDKQRVWEHFKRDENWPQPKKLILHFRILSFGDGTGFWGNEGLAVPRATSEKSSTDPCAKESAKHSDLNRWRLSRDVETFSVDDLPADSLLANFLPIKLSHPSSLNSKSRPQDCCPGNGCFRSRPYLSEPCYSCGPKDRLDATFCSDPFGACRSATYNKQLCEVDETGLKYYCLQVDFVPCGGATPTPVPSPTSSPAPSPSGSPTPKCDLPENTKPNPTCYCNLSPFDTPYWQCATCPGGIAADFTVSTNLQGCPANMYLTDNFCCKCVQEQSCQPGYAWNSSSCQCTETDVSGGGDSSSGDTGRAQVYSYCVAHILVTDHYLCYQDGHCDYLYSDYEWLGTTCSPSPY